MQNLPKLEYGKYYHIYNRGNNGENIFREERNYSYFLQLYEKYIAPVAETFCYCLLRNHFHLLLRIKALAEQEENLKQCIVDKVLKPTQQFSNFFNSYAKAINKAYGRTGSLFQKRFGRIEVTSESYFIPLVHYIHFNPQKHDFVDDFRDYKYSSYQSLLSTWPTKLNRERVMDWFEGKTQFLAVHQQRVDEQGIAYLIGDGFD